MIVQRGGEEFPLIFGVFVVISKVLETFDAELYSSSFALFSAHW